MTWQEMLDEIERRVQQGTYTSATTGDGNIPYFDRAHAEELLYEISVQLMLEMPDYLAETLGDAALVTASLANAAAIPLNYLKCFAVRIDGNLAKELSPASYYQLNLPATSPYTIAVYSFGAGVIGHSGTTAVATFLVQPTLATFQANTVVLPPQYDEPRITWVHELMLAQDFLPEGVM